MKDKARTVLRDSHEIFVHTLGYKSGSLCGTTMVLSSAAQAQLGAPRTHRVVRALCAAWIARHVVGAPLALLAGTFAALRPARSIQRSELGQACVLLSRIYQD